jgi:hypothetical protein
MVKRVFGKHAVSLLLPNLSSMEGHQWSYPYPQGRACYWEVKEQGVEGGGAMQRVMARERKGDCSGSG